MLPEPPPTEKAIESERDNAQPKTLVLFFNESWIKGGAAPEAWQFDDDGVLLTRRSMDARSLQGGHAQAAPPRCVLVLPGSMVTTTSLVIPKTYLRRHRDSLPFLFEDILLGEPQQQHIAIGRPAADGKIPVAIIDKSSISDILQRVAKLGLRLEAIYSDADLLVAEENCLSLLAHADQLLFRAGDAQAVLPAGAALLPELLAGYADRSMTALAIGETAARQLASLPNMNVTVLPGSTEQYLAARAADPEGRAINLLQHEFAPRGAVPRASMSTWLVGGLCSCFLLAAAYFGVMATAIEWEAATQRKATTTAVREFIPGFRSSRSVRLEVTRHIEASLASRDTQVNFPEFISRFSLAWQHVGLDSPIIKSLRFSRPDAEVQMDIDGIVVPEVERLQTALGEKGLVAKVMSVNSSQLQPEKSLLRLRITMEKP